MLNEKKTKYNEKSTINKNRTMNMEMSFFFFLSITVSLLLILEKLKTLFPVFIANKIKDNILYQNN